ncbi:hypothetical protein M7I_2858 [Glarea lozoyensis 74030]|nr:hypothetical protein M7I_2858 [Glarea lozoyensis 74030]
MFEREQHRVVLSNNEQRATSAEQAFESYKALAGRVEQGLQERVQVLEGENKTLRSENLTLRYERDMARHGLNGIKQWISQVENENTALKDKFRTRWEEHMAELTRVKAECDKRIADAEIAEKKWRIKHDEVHLSKADLTRKQSLHIEQIRAEAKQKYIQLFTELDTQGCETYAGFGSYVKSAQAMCKFMSAQITGEAVSMGVYANEVTKHDKDFARYVKEFRESLEPQDGEEPKWQAMAASTAAREAFFKELEGLTKSLGEVKGGLGTVRKGLEGKMKAEGEELEKIRKELLDLKTVRSKDQTSLKAELERKTKEHASLKKEVEHKNSLMGTRKTEIEALKASGKKLDDALRTLKAESYDLIASSQKRYETAEAKCLSQSAGLQRRDLKLAELTQKLADLSEKMEEKKREVEQLDKYLEQKNKEIAELEKGQLGTTDAFLPLTEIGILVRTRYLEKLKPYRGQNKSLIEAGDLAAHGGAPLADALLFSYTLPSIVAPRTDFHVFEQLYETCISDVEELRELVPFQEVLRWNGWMKTLRNHQLREEAERFLKMTKGLLEEGRKVGLEVWFQGAEGKKGFEECENLWVECRNEFKNESGGK